MRVVVIVMLAVMFLALGALEILAARPSMESARPLPTSQEWREQ